jgi:tetratricopeptide (TPR) repeat protein
MHTIRLTALCFLSALLFVAGLSVAPAAQSNREAEALLQSAVNKEIIDGDVNGAIKLYQEITAKFSSNNRVAATALVRLGQLYEKTGNSEAAQAVYKRVLSDYKDQSAAVVDARRGLNPFPSGQTTANSSLKGLTRLCSDGVCSWDEVTPDGRYLLGLNGLRDLASGEERRIWNDMRENFAFYGGRKTSGVRDPPERRGPLRAAIVRFQPVAGHAGKGAAAQRGVQLQRAVRVESGRQGRVRASLAKGRHEPHRRDPGIRRPAAADRVLGMAMAGDSKPLARWTVHRVRRPGR